MYFLGIGLVVLIWKFSQVGPPQDWAMNDWIIIAVPFGLAAAWWWWADSTGYTKRKAMEREDQRRQARIDKNKEAIGTDRKRRR